MTRVGFVKLVVVAGVASLFTGCFGPTLPDYKPKELEKDARAVTVAKSTPYNCKLLGETEGRDDSENKSAPTPQKIREGAMNDLRNNALAVGGNKRSVVAITREEVICEKTSSSFFGLFTSKSTYDCTKQASIPGDTKVLHHTIYGQVFDCGDK